MTSPPTSDDWLLGIVRGIWQVFFPPPPLPYVTMITYPEQFDTTGGLTSQGTDYIPYPKWLGALGFQVAASGLNVPSYWNTHMQAGDIANCNLAAEATVIAGVTVGTVRAGLSDDGVTNQVTAGNLTTIDTNLQAAHGAIVETINYTDDQLTGSVQNHITHLTTNVGTIHNFARANGAPAFKASYIPGGKLLNDNLSSTTSALVTTADELVFQTQEFEDQPGGIDNAYLGTVASVMARVAQFTSNPVIIQVQCESKTTDQAWTVGKMVSDINAMGAIYSPKAINIFFDTTGLTTFQSVILFYRH